MIRKIIKILICLNIGYWSGYWTHKEFVKCPKGHALNIKDKNENFIESCGTETVSGRMDNIKVRLTTEPDYDNALQDQASKTADAVARAASEMYKMAKEMTQRGKK